jgi:hypothetical protein
MLGLGVPLGARTWEGCLLVVQPIAIDVVGESLIAKPQTKHMSFPTTSPPPNSPSYHPFPMGPFWVHFCPMGVIFIPK